MPSRLRFVRRLFAILVAIGFSFAVLGTLAAAPPADWSGAQWIWDASDAPGESSTKPRFVRRTFELAAAPSKAELAITADNSYVVYVNGQKVGADDSWNSVESYDVAKHLRAGKNTVAVRAANQGGPAGLLVWLGVTVDNKPLSIASGPSWRLTTQESAGWEDAAFDDAAWKPAVSLGAAGIGPWNLAGAPNPGGSADRNVSNNKITSYRPASEEIEQFQLPEGFAIELVAAEPLIINPVCLALDERGRMYVSESHTYRYGPKGSPVAKPSNPIVRLDPTPDGYRRVLVAEGFDDPVMGMLVRGGKLWAAANNLLYRFDLQDGQEPLGTNRTLLVEDKNKAWNPFGMFVLEPGPEGLVYLSVGNHNIDLRGPTNTATGRGSSGIVVRMNEDGSNLERLVHGLRVPYSFEFDPFGQLWLLSNGEGNPNRFVRVIEGVDYHCYSRPAASNEWLAGRHPLAPPCQELPRGACTQLLRYYSAAYPAAYQGSLLLDNWGAHGFAAPNRTIFRYIPDARNDITAKEEFLVCRDPHFRCSHVLYDPDGNLLIADWYGRDDESDQTGRIWRVVYRGADKPRVEHTLDSPQWRETTYAIAALGSPHHAIRHKATDELARRPEATAALTKHAASSDSAIGAAQALWTLVRLNTPEARRGLADGAKHADWRVRRLALQLVQRFDGTAADALAQSLARDADPAVRVSAAVARKSPADTRTDLLAALDAGAAADAHLRYEAAWHLARTADAASLQRVLASDDANVRLAGLIALDVALYEKFDTADAALQSLLAALADPRQLDLQLVLEIARLNRSAEMAAPLQALLARTDATPAMTGQALLLLRSIPGQGSAQIGEAAAQRFLAAVAAGEVSLKSSDDVLTMLRLLPSSQPSAFALQSVQARLNDNNTAVREQAHALARGYGRSAASLAPTIWSRLLGSSKTPLADRLALLTTLLEIEAEPDAERWSQLWNDPDAGLVADAVRSFRRFADRPDQMPAQAKRLLAAAPELLKKHPDLSEDLSLALVALKADGLEVAMLKLAVPSATVEARRAATLAGAVTPHGAALGRRVFERAGCVKCHTTVSDVTLRAPSLKGIGKAQKREYLVESLFEPSKTIKTGFEIETVVTTSGKVHNGLVKDEGDALRIITVDGEVRVSKKDVDERQVQKKSLMPDGLHQGLSQSELNDLIAYLASLQ